MAQKTEHLLMAQVRRQVTMQLSRHRKMRTPRSSCTRSDSECSDSVSPALFSVTFGLCYVHNVAPNIHSLCIYDANYYRYVVAELIETEKDYVRDLGLIVDVS